jgi:hypothetical protein
MADEIVGILSLRILSPVYPVDINSVYQGKYNEIY